MSREKYEVTLIQTGNEFSTDPALYVGIHVPGQKETKWYQIYNGGSFKKSPIIPKGSLPHMNVTSREAYQLRQEQYEKVTAQEGFETDSYI